MKKLATAGALALVAAAVLHGQVEVTKGLRDDPPFDVDAVSFASEVVDSQAVTPSGRGVKRLSRLDIFAAIPYEQLSFVKDGDRFVAGYEFTIALYDSFSALVTEKTYTGEVKVPTFELSVSSAAYSVERLNFYLPPGLYRMIISYRDRESRVTRRVARQIVVSDYTLPGLQLSDIMLISRLTTRDQKRVFTPSISPNVGNISGPMHVFFETYNDQAKRPLRFVCTVFTDRNVQTFRTDTIMTVEAGRNQIFIKLDQTVLPIGNYKLYVQAFEESDTSFARPLATTSRSFIVRWDLLPKTIKDLDLAIEQLVYIAKDRELSYIKEAKTNEEKQKRFLEFWKKKDPNPNTVRNEKMDEYYARVEYANKHFKHYAEGWRTDMGMVYIIFGAPSNVDRHPFDSNAKPYEVWSYYDLNYSFVFVDQTGFGDYRLTRPIWEVWQRARE